MIGFFTVLTLLYVSRLILAHPWGGGGGHWGQQSHTWAAHGGQTSSQTEAAVASVTSAPDTLPPSASEEPPASTSEAPGTAAASGPDTISPGSAGTADRAASGVSTAAISSTPSAGTSSGGAGTCASSGVGLGIDATLGDLTAFTSVSGSKLSWYYNWDLTPTQTDTCLEFVPMVWGSGSADQIAEAVESWGNVKAILSFNERESGQSVSGRLFGQRIKKHKRTLTHRPRRRLIRHGRRSIKASTKSVPQQYPTEALPPTKVRLGSA